MVSEPRAATEVPSGDYFEQRRREVGGFFKRWGRPLAAAHRGGVHQGGRLSIAGSLAEPSRKRFQARQMAIVASVIRVRVLIGETATPIPPP